MPWSELHIGYAMDWIFYFMSDKFARKFQIHLNSGIISRISGNVDYCYISCDSISLALVCEAKKLTCVRDPKSNRHTRVQSSWSVFYLRVPLAHRFLKRVYDENSMCALMYSLMAYLWKLKNISIYNKKKQLDLQLSPEIRCECFNELWRKSTKYIF